MSSCLMKNQDSDEEVDLEALRLAALKSRKPKYKQVNHNNLIPIVPVPVETLDFINTKIKKEKVSPTKEVNTQDENRINKENEDEKISNYSGLTLENDQDILSMDDKEEEDSLERLMDQLEAEITGKAPTPADKTVNKSLSSDKNDKKENFDDEIELVQVKTGKEPNTIIEIRESASPDANSKAATHRKSVSRSPRSFGHRYRSGSRSRSRSPFLKERGYKRSRSPYWYRSPHRSRSPFRRSRSPFWLPRRSRSKSRSPLRRHRSPFRKRSPFSHFSRSRSISYGRRSPWSISPRRRSKSPFYHDDLPPRPRNFNSPERYRRSFSPRRSSNSPRRRSRSPRRYHRNSPYRRSKSPLRRSRSPFRKSLRRSPSPFLGRSKSPFGKLGKLNSPDKLSAGQRFSKSPGHGSLPRSSEKLSPKPRSKEKYKGLRRSPRQEGDLKSSMSPNHRKTRSPLKAVEKNKLDSNDKIDKSRNRNEKRHRSLSRENRTNDRRPYRQKYYRRFSPSNNKKSSERQIRKSKSPKPRDAADKNKGDIVNSKETEPSAVPLDPVLEARKKKFETLGEVIPTADKKINLKAIKDSSENVEDDEDAITLNIESNLWDESESDDECESRFKSDAGKQSRFGTNNRKVLSFRNLGNEDEKKINLKRSLEDGHCDRFRRDRHENLLRVRRNDKSDSKRKIYDRRNENIDSNRRVTRGNDEKNRKSDSIKSEKGSNRKPIVWSSKNEQSNKDNEVSTTQNEAEERTKTSERTVNDNSRKDHSTTVETDDFDKLISDFEKELENDICISMKEASSPTTPDKEEVKKPKIALKKDLCDPKNEPVVRKTVPRIVKISQTVANKIDRSCDMKNVNKIVDITEEVIEPQPIDDGPEDYEEDDDFVLEVPEEKKKNKEEKDSQSDLRAVLSRRRNERLTKAVSLQENMPTRLVQSAFQDLRNKKPKRQIREVQDTSEFSLLGKGGGAEGRKVLLLHREKNSVQSFKCAVPEVKPDTTIHQRFIRSNTRRTRKLQRQLDSIEVQMEDVEQEEEEQDGLEVEEERQFRRFRLKRNVTLSSQFHVTIIVRWGIQSSFVEAELRQVQKTKFLILDSWESCRLHLAPD